MTVREGIVHANVVANPVRAALIFTRGTGPLSERVWESTAATLRDGRVSTPLPPGRPLAYFVSAVDAAGVHATAPFEQTGGL